MIGGGRLGAWLGRAVARHRRNPLLRKAASAARLYLAWHGNNNFDLMTNGETFVLDTVGAFRPSLLVDVGANVGEWARTASARCPGAVVHAFEIAAPTFAALAANTRHLERVHAHCEGLSDREGPLLLRYFGEQPALTTVLDYPHPFAHSPIEGSTITGDAFMAREGITHIDLLKIDAEGMEDRVLRGFQGAFDRRGIDVVQFEYGRASILTRFLLRDYHAFFEPRGYVVGRLFPDHVAFGPYQLPDEDFLGGNHLACRADRADYLRALGGGNRVRA